MENKNMTSPNTTKLALAAIANMGKDKPQSVEQLAQQRALMASIARIELERIEAEEKAPKNEQAAQRGQTVGNAVKVGDTFARKDWGNGSPCFYRSLRETMAARGLIIIDTGAGDPVVACA